MRGPKVYKPQAERVAELRAIVRLMPDGTVRMSLRIDQGLRTAKRFDVQLVKQEPAEVLSENVLEFQDAVVVGLTLAAKGMERKVAACKEANERIAAEGGVR